MKVFLILLGALLMGDTLALSMVSNGNLGVWLPGILGLPLLLWGLFYAPVSAWFATPLGHWVRGIILFGYGAFLAFLFITTALLRHAEQKTASPGCDALIVLGCAVRGDRVSLTLKYRLDAALNYLEESPNTLAIVSGSQGAGEDISEARAMADYLIAHGIATDRILLEDRATSTYENFLFSKAMIETKLGENATVAFVTTGFHTYRAAGVARQCGLAAAGIPAKDIWYSAPNNYIRECIAVTMYKIRGLL